MIAYLEGTVAEKGANELILDVMGVGYQLICSMNTLQSLPQKGETVRVYTFMSVSQDAIALFGFATREEKRMFAQLTGVSGIGPRTAVNILGSMPLRDLSLAIVTGDITALSRAPGIGKKTAQRIALELKETITKESLSFAPDIAAAALPVEEDAVREALAALQTLGYSAVEAAQAVAKVREKTDKPDEMVRLALRHMAGM